MINLELFTGEHDPQCPGYEQVLPPHCDLGISL